MSKTTVPGNPSSALPMPGLSKRAQQIASPSKNQFSIGAIGKAAKDRARDKTRSIVKVGI
jgi:hypothetical protein